jgi:prevent-host-death family protein
MKKTAAVAELKAQLSRYLSRVKAGEEILVTERGAPVARLVPVGHGDHGHEHWRDLERQGLMRLGSGKLPKDFWKLPRGRDARASVRKAVSEDREAGW